MWERAGDCAAKHGGLTNGLHEHVWYGLRHDYDHDARYRDLIRALAEVRMLDDVERPDGATAQ
jgi:hypothetical protein